MVKFTNYDSELDYPRYDEDEYSGAPTVHTGITSSIPQLKERIYVNEKLQQVEPTVMDSAFHQINT